MCKRNELIDFFKGIFAIGVVFVHFPFPGVIGQMIASIGVVGVIFFFLISGYQSYSPNGESANKLLIRFKRNLILTVFAVLVYFVFTVIEQLIQGTFGEWIVIFQNPITYIKMIILGDFTMVHADALWFMPALIYGYLIMYIIEKKRLNKIFYLLLPFLLLLRCGMETYTNSFSDISWLDWHFSGNFLVGALPIMLLGNFLHRFVDKVKNINGAVVITAIIFARALVFLFVNVKVCGMNISQPFKIIATTLVFVICLIYDKAKAEPHISRFEKRYTLYIYLYHFLIGIFIIDMFEYFDLSEYCYDYILPFVVLALSTLLSVIMYKKDVEKIKSSIKNKLKNIAI